jgi:ADP-L-glycero-D-manno-heptose 6-epimerase
MLVITGGAGFIGSNLVAALDKTGAGPLVVADWVDEGKKPNLGKHTVAKIINPDALLDFLKAEGGDVDTIFHMGAISSTMETDLSRLNKYNLEYSKNLYRWCAENGKRFIYASSAATYGAGDKGFSDQTHPSELKPLNPYGRSKNDFDLFAAEQTGKKPPQVVGLKFFNVYGPNEYHKGRQRSVAHQIYPVAAQGETFQLFKSHNPAYPNGGQRRDFIYVNDCVDVMLWLYRNPQVNGLFNLGTGKARSFADLAAAVYRAAGQEPKIAYKDMPQNLRVQYQYFTEGPMEKLRQAGYAAPFTSLEDGIKAYVQGYLATNDPYC